METGELAEGLGQDKPRTTEQILAEELPQDEAEKKETETAEETKAPEKAEAPEEAVTGMETEKN